MSHSLLKLKFLGSLIRSTLLSLSVAITLQQAASAQSAQPTQGCPIPPPPSASSHDYYVDPVHGSMTGDGSATHPWHTLSEVVTANLISSMTHGGGTPTASLKPLNPNGVVKPGDTIHLLSGNHGVVNIYGYDNPAFITVVAVPGQTPVISRITIDGSTNWAFKNITFQSLATTLGSSLVNIDTGTWYGSSDHLFFAENRIESQADVSAWTQQDWINKGQNGASVRKSASYISFLGNRFQNVRNGIQIAGTNVLFEFNTINNFGDDGLDYGGSLITIRHNSITNSHLLGDGNHNDAMQGQIPYPNGIPDLTPHHDILIDANYVNAMANPNLPFLSDGVTSYGGQTGMQGIDAFDGVWNNVTVTNNVVLITAYHGISYYGAKWCQIINNTVEEISSNPKLDAWIGVFNMKSTNGGTAPVDNVVRNNVAQSFILTTTGVTADHNIKAVVGTATDPQKLFMAFQPSLAKYDMRILLPSSPLIGAGSTLLAPTHDYYFLPRVAPIDVGAYSKAASLLTVAQ